MRKAGKLTKERADDYYVKIGARFKDRAPTRERQFPYFLSY